MAAVTAPDAPLILAHRGASAHAPENTLRAFRLAVDQAADGIECDVRRTADGVLVMHHDVLVDGLGPVADIAFENLRRSRPDIPTLDETLEALPEPGFVLNIEVKHDPDEPGYDPSIRIACQVAEWVEDHDVADRVIVSSFDRPTVDAVARMRPGTVTGVLLNHRANLRATIGDLDATEHRWVLPHYSQLLVGARAKVAMAHDAGLHIGTWTVDARALITRLALAGLDAVISNDPAAARRALPA